MKKIYAKVTSLLLIFILTFSCTTVFATERETNILANTLLDDVIKETSAKYKFGITTEELYKNALHEIIAEYPELMEIALEGIYNNLDEYSTYFPYEDFNSFIEDVSGEFCGIGVTIMEFDDGLLVTEVHKGTAAESVGIRKGDYIISADGNDIRDMDLETARNYIVGLEGTSVNIGIMRNGEIMNFDMIRSVVTTTPGFYQVLDGNIGYIQLSSFDEHSPEFMAEALENLKDYENIIFDLRYNPGGSLDALQAIAELMLPKGPIMHLEFREPINNTAIVNEIGASEHKLVVLVNNYTASAAEAFSAAVQDYGVGVVVGEQTTGKGTMQTVSGFFLGGGYKLTVAEYLSPNKRKINEIGVTPDFYIAPKKVIYDDKYFEKPTYERKLNSGDEGLDVLAFEERLNVLGYAVGVPDKVFDDDTFYAVKKFQEAAGLYPYGVLDITTQLAIINALENEEIYLDTAMEKAMEIATGDIDDYIKEAAENN